METVEPRPTPQSGPFPVSALTTDMLSAFVKVAEHASVSRAAADLDVAKGVVSKRVAQLEARLRATLFSRSTRRVARTPAGEAYLEHARRALHEVASAEERLRDLRAQLSGPIRITGPVSWSQRVLAPCLPEFLRQHPAIEIELTISDRMVDLAVERIDLALRWTSTPTPGLAAEPVAHVGFALVAAPSYLAAAGMPRSPQALARKECLSYWRESSDDAWAFADARGRKVQVHARGRYHANDVGAVAQAAEAGLGVALLPGYMCEEALATGRLVRVLPRWTPETRFGTKIMALATPERMRLARIRALLAHLRQRLAEGAAPGAA